MGGRVRCNRRVYVSVRRLADTSCLVYRCLAATVFFSFLKKSAAVKYYRVVDSVSVNTKVLMKITQISSVAQHCVIHSDRGV